MRKKSTLSKDLAILHFQLQETFLTSAPHCDDTKRIALLVMNALNILLQK